MPKPKASPPPTAEETPTHRYVTITIPIVDDVRFYIPEKCNLGRIKQSRGRVLKQVMQGIDAAGVDVVDGGWKTGSVAINLILDRIEEAIAESE